MPATQLDRLCANTLRGLAMDAVQRARSGHPGMPMGMADAACVLWTRFLVHDPSAPNWPDRDRFVLSAGHGSTLLYGLLHLTGYRLSLDDLRAFRSWGSATPGHPELGRTPGVETTTGPLGQGLANAVGMALAERWLRERFGPELVDHRVYAIASDGDLMEGISSEAGSLAGHLGLGRLVVLYDDNRISIDGSTGLAFTEDRGERFRALGWQVLRADGHDQDSVAAAIGQALADDGRPSLVMCRTHIGFGSPHKQDSASCHGSPLGEEELRLAKLRLGLDPDAAFAVPPEVREHMRASTGRGRQARLAWEQRLEAHPQAERWRRFHAAPDLSAVSWPGFEAGSTLATRKASEAALNAAAGPVEQLLGGSADLTGSNGTRLRGLGAISRDDFSGRMIHFGVREHAMASICNGLALHGGVVPFCATFLVFHDYMRPAVRLAALMRRRVVFIYTHDSILVGEDGPTHQPVEQLMSLRLIPGVVDLRPADAAETVEAWKVALSWTEGPVCLVLTRQGLPVLDRGRLGAADGLARGAYVLAEAAGRPRAVLVATGSEVSLALRARELLGRRGVGVRVVSMPSWALFARQDAAWRDAVLPPGLPRVSVEAGVTLGWERWLQGGVAVGIDRFGASAPGPVVARELGLGVDAVLGAVERVLA